MHFNNSNSANINDNIIILISYQVESDSNHKDVLSDMKQDARIKQMPFSSNLHPRSLGSSAMMFSLNHRSER